MSRKHIFIVTLIILGISLFLLPKHSNQLFYYDPELKRYIIPWYNKTFIYTFNNPKTVLTTFKENLTNFNYSYIYRFSKIYFIYDPYLTGNFSLGIVSLLNHIILPLKRLGFNVTYVCLRPYNSTYCQIIGNESVCNENTFCIIYKKGSDKVKIENNKLYIIGKEEDILKLIDLVVLRFYGIKIN